MSLSKLFPYIRSNMDALGFQELEREFDDINIAGTVMDKSYRITPDTLSSGPSNSLDYEWTFPVTIEFYRRGYRKTSDAVDGAILESEKIMDEIFEVEARYSQAGIRDIYPQQISFEQFSSDNDSIIKCKISMTAKIQIFNSKNC